MEILAQSKQITCNRKILKGLLVLNLFVFFISCKAPVKVGKKQTIPEVAILKQIIANRIKFEKDHFMVVAIENSNMEIINIIKEFKENSENPKQLDTLRALYGIENVFLKRNEHKISLIDSILNKKEYDFLLTQADQNSEWGNAVTKTLTKTENMAFNFGNYDIYISQPVYAKSKTLALVFVYCKSHSVIAIMGLRNNKWKELYSFAYMLY